LQIEVDPHFPRHLPQIKFLGPDKLIQPLKDALNRTKEWDDTKGLRSNLEHCLNISFPKPVASEKEQNASEMIASCGICYEFHFGDDDSILPDVVCGNERCQKSFHRKCLYDWLRSVPSTKQSFSTMFGVCPFCDQALSFVVK
jgi:E3 ubiquitin-protein ligase FANCL